MTIEQIEALEDDAARMRALADKAHELGAVYRFVAAPVIRLTAWNWRRVARAERRRLGA